MATSQANPRSGQQLHTAHPIHNHPVKLLHPRPMINEEACSPHGPALPRYTHPPLRDVAEGKAGAGRYRREREARPPPPACPRRARQQHPLDRRGGKAAVRDEQAATAPASRPPEAARSLAAPVTPGFPGERATPAAGDRGAGEEPGPAVLPSRAPRSKARPPLPTYRQHLPSWRGREGPFAAPRGCLRC